jgi:hypothetical protein
MQSIAGWILYLVFAVILFGMYLAIRRQWAPPGMVAGLGIVTSIACMILISLTQGNMAVQAVVVGILVGLLFSLATLAAAWYFHTKELRAKGIAPVQPSHDEEEY